MRREGSEADFEAGLRPLAESYMFPICSTREGARDGQFPHPSGRNVNTRILQLKRYRALPSAGSRTLFFATPSTDRRHPSMFYRPDDVPEFDGDTGWFLAERVTGGWRIVRRVQEDGGPWPD
jgi:hypothetical protein